MKKENDLWNKFHSDRRLNKDIDDTMNFDYKLYKNSLHRNNDLFNKMKTNWQSKDPSI